MTISAITDWPLVTTPCPRSIEWYHANESTSAWSCATSITATDSNRGSAALIRPRHEHALQALEALEATAGAEHDAFERRIDEVHRQIGLGADAVARARAAASRRRRGARR